MISSWKERKIRRVIAANPDISERNLARIFEVSRKAIRNITKAPGLRPRTIPRPQRKLKISKRCKECGALLEIWPCLSCRPWAYYYDDPTLEEPEEFNDARKAA